MRACWFFSHDWTGWKYVETITLYWSDRSTRPDGYEKVFKKTCTQCLIEKYKRVKL